MAFMVPQYTNEDFFEVTTEGGEGWLVPAEGFGKSPDPSDFADYVEFGTPEEVERVSGWFARLSAPGYLDATPWAGPFETEQEAREYIEETWEVDPDTGDSLEENPGSRRTNANRGDVIDAWARGKRKKASALRTEGGKLYSYDLLIGETLPDGTRVVYDYTGPNRISQTTTVHVNAAKAVAAEVREPPERQGRWGNPKMTKREFEEYFSSEVLPMVAEKYEQDGIPDKPARREAWNDTVDFYIQEGMLPESAGNWSHPRWLETRKPNPMGPVGRTALGAGLGSLGGAVVGGAVLQGPGAAVGSIAGGAVGGHYAAPDDRKKRGAWGGGLGGGFGPIGAAVGGAIAGDKPDKKKNPELRKLKNKLLR
jgi:hypothetical protein